MEKILSVSVACYNLGDMITENLRSFCETPVAPQIEMLVIDDGSTDDTPELIKPWVEKYPDTVKYLRQENAGPGSTINTALQHATGKYFRLVDGDDWVQTENLPAYLELLAKTDADLVLSDFALYDDQQKKIIRTESYDLPAGTNLLLEQCVTARELKMHTMTYRTALLRQQAIIFDPGFYTDNEYVQLPMVAAETVTYSPGVIYVYRVARPGQSVSPQNLIKHLPDHEAVANRLLSVYAENRTKFSRRKAQIYGERLGIFAMEQVGVYLLLPPCRANKERIKKFAAALKQNCPAAYRELKRTRRFRVLHYSHYLLYKWAAKTYARSQGVTYAKKV